MGGKNAIVVDSSADLDAAAAGIVTSAFGFQGQKCSAGSRVIALHTVHDARQHKHDAAAGQQPAAALTNWRSSKLTGRRTSPAFFLPAREIFLSFCGCGIAELQMPPTGGACAGKRDSRLDGAARPIHFGVF